MTRLVLAVSFALVIPIPLASTLVAQMSPETPKFRIVISAGKQELPLGSDVSISIKTTNLSEEPIPMQFGFHGNLPDGFRFEVRDERGTKLTRRVYDDIRPTRPAGSTRSGELSPGKSTEAVALISDIYSFDRPGQYTIRVWLQAKRSNDDTEPNRIYSNTVTIKVVKPDESDKSAN